MNKITFSKHHNNHMRTSSNIISNLLKNCDEWTIFDSPITSVPSIDFIKKVATMILHGMPLPTLKFYYEFDSQSTSWKATSVNKESEDLFKAIICLYRPECVSSEQDITVYLPVDDSDFSFSSCLDRKAHLIECRELEKQDKQHSVDQLEWFQSYIKNAQIRTLSFNSKDIADAYNELSL